MPMRHAILSGEEIRLPETEHEDDLHDGDSRSVSFSALAFSVTPGAAKGGPIVPPGRYCLSYNEGGTDCSFTSYAQCEATASGIDAECYGPSFPDEKSFRNWVGRTGGFYQGPTY
jgi:hypothetical protein